MSQDKPDAPQAVRQTNQSFFFEADIFSAGRLIARRARPGGVVHEAPRAVPVLRDCNVLVVGGEDVRLEEERLVGLPHRLGSVRLVLAHRITPWCAPGCALSRSARN